jgi:hypothetical protein
LDPTITFADNDIIYIMISLNVMDKSGNTIILNSGDGYYTTDSKIVSDAKSPIAYVKETSDYDQKIVVQWNEKVRQVSNNTKSPIVDDIMVSFDNGVTFTQFTSLSTYGYDDNNYRMNIIYNEGAKFKAGDYIVFKFNNIQDVNENKIEPVSDYLTDPIIVADTTGPTGTIISATDNDNIIKVKWDEDLAVISNVAASVMISVNGGVNINLSNKSYDSDNFVMTLDTTSAIPISTGDSVVLSFSWYNSDSSGNSVGNTASSHYELPVPFVVQDNTNPTATLISAGNNQKVIIEYSESPYCKSTTNLFLIDVNVLDAFLNNYPYPKDRKYFYICCPV